MMKAVLAFGATLAVAGAAQAAFVDVTSLWGVSDPQFENWTAAADSVDLANWTSKGPAACLSQSTDVPSGGGTYSVQFGLGSGATSGGDIGVGVDGWRSYLHAGDKVRLTATVKILNDVAADPNNPSDTSAWGGPFIGLTNWGAGDSSPFFSFSASRTAVGWQTLSGTYTVASGDLTDYGSRPKSVSLTLGNDGNWAAWGGSFLLDKVKIEYESVSAPVPEPASLGLLGLGGLLMLRRRRV